MTAHEDESSTAYAIRVVKEHGAREALTALRDRCAEKIPALRQLADEHDTGTPEKARIRGKIEGVKLTLSYLDEQLRELGR